MRAQASRAPRAAPAHRSQPHYRVIMRNQQRGARESKLPLEMSELYGKCPCPTGLVGERLENSLPESRGDQILSQFASLLGVKMNFGDEADAEVFPAVAVGR